MSTPEISYPVTGLCDEHPWTVHAYPVRVDEGDACLQSIHGINFDPRIKVGGGVGGCQRYRYRGMFWEVCMYKP